MNIVQTRIDNRLVHGQVGMTWLNSNGCNLIIVANDEVANDEIQQELMEMIMPEHVGIRFFSIEETIAKLPKAADRQLMFLVVRSPQDVLKIIEGGIPLNEVNVGNIHFSEGKVKLTNQIALNKEEKEAIIKLDELKVKLNTCQVPNADSIDIITMIKKEDLWK